MNFIRQPLSICTQCTVIGVLRFASTWRSLKAQSFRTAALKEEVSPVKKAFH